MKLDNKDCQTLLAGAYVLGTLQGRARQRFERLLADRPDLRRQVHQWTEDLQPLTSAVESVEPSASLWHRIDGAIGPVSARTMRSRVGIWQGLAIAATLAAIVFGGLWQAATQRLAPPQYVAVLGPSVHPAWAMTLGDHGRTLAIASISPPNRKNHSYQLWMLPGHGQPPHALVLLPTRPGITINIHIPAALHLAQASGMAVSLEPPHGSPMPGPSGPVLYESSWIQIIDKT